MRKKKVRKVIKSFSTHEKLFDDAVTICVNKDLSLSREITLFLEDFVKNNKEHL